MIFKNDLERQNNINSCIIYDNFLELYITQYRMTGRRPEVRITAIGARGGVRRTECWLDPGDLERSVAQRKVDWGEPAFRPTHNSKVLQWCD